MTMQIVSPLSNRVSLCIGEITTTEALNAMVDNPAFDGEGLYLVSVDQSNPQKQGEVLAKFVSEDAARVLANYFRVYGAIERQ